VCVKECAGRLEESRAIINPLGTFPTIRAKREPAGSSGGSDPKKRAGRGWKIRYRIEEAIKRVENARQGVMDTKCETQKQAQRGREGRMAINIRMNHVKGRKRNESLMHNASRYIGSSG
jgi:hypothetical protein